MATPRNDGSSRWWLAAVLFLATALTYLDRQTIALCAPSLSTEFGLSAERYGELLSAFRWVYAIAQSFAGLLVDRLPVRPLYAVAVAAWSVAGVATAFAKSFPQLLFTRSALGLGEAFNWPCATRIVADEVPPEERALASGIFNSGSAAGSLFAPVIILTIAAKWGWRGAFVVVGASGFVWLPLWLLVAKKRSSVTRNAPRLGLPATLRLISSHPAFWILLIVGVCANPCWYFLSDWTPKFLHDHRGMTQMSAGMVTVPIFLCGGLGNVAGGALVKLLTMRGMRLDQARMAVALLAVALIAPVAWVGAATSAAGAVTLLGMAALGLCALLANYTACQQTFLPGLTGSVAGILGMACNVFSAVANPWIGAVVDRTGSYRTIFAVIGILGAIAALGLLGFDWLMRRRGVKA